LVPNEASERCEALLERNRRLEAMRNAAASVQAELPGPFSPEHEREMTAWVMGELSGPELLRRTIERHRQP
jgi:hypothetical protein